MVPPNVWQSLTCLQVRNCHFLVGSQLGFGRERISQPIGVHCDEKDTSLQKAELPRDEGFLTKKIPSVEGHLGRHAGAQRDWSRSPCIPRTAKSAPLLAASCKMKADARPTGGGSRLEKEESMVTTTRLRLTHQNNEINTNRRMQATHPRC